MRKQRVDKQVANTRECVCEGSQSTCRSARAGGKQAKKGKNLNLKMKVFPSSEQKSDDIKPPKHDHCDFETSLRIQIRHDLDNE